jgi:drug/metabolite transporter (DMT)-like permease
MTQQTRREHLDGLAMALLVVCCLFWGFQQVLVKATLPEVPPLLQAAVRFALATSFLWLWCKQRGIALFERDGSLGSGLLAGVLFCGEFVCIYLGLQYTTASRLTIFLYTSPFWVALLLPLWVPSERLRLSQWVGMAVAFAGVGVALHEGLLATDVEAHPLLWVGDWLAIAAGAFWGLTTVVIRAKGLTRLSPEKLLYYQVAVCTVLLPIASIQTGEVWDLDWSAFAWGSILVQSAVGAFASYLVWMWMLGRYPATRLSVFVFLTPVFALLFGMGWLGEAVSASLWLALAGVSLGIVLVNRR